ncbi:MAG: hypothetical protein ACQEQM_06170 [Thermoplasmatota archaeon]
MKPPSKSKLSLDYLLDEIRSLKDEYNRYAVYLIFVYLFSLPLIFVLLFVDPCLFNLAVPAFALLIPYHVFKEKNFKIIGVVGIVALILLGLTFTAYQVETIYIGREPEELSSDNLIQGRIDKVHGNVDEGFEFDVIVKQEAYEELIHDNNYTVQLNLSWYVEEEEEAVAEYQMNYVEDVQNQGKRYSVKINDIGEELYEHSFLLTIDRENEDYQEETNTGYGPFTVSRGDLYLTIMAQQASSSIITFLLFFGFLWWRTGILEKSKKRKREKEKERIKEEMVEESNQKE